MTTLAQVIQRAIDARLADLRVALPGRIESFDPETQLARVKPLIHETHETPGGEATAPLPIVSDVPVQFPGGGGFVVTFPVAAGDPCWLVFADRALDAWLQSGRDGEPVDLRRHALSDAVAILGVRSRAGALAEFDAGGARLGAEGGVGVQVRSGEVHLGVEAGANAADAVALASKVEAELARLADVLRMWVPVPTDGGLTLRTLLIPLLGPIPLAPPTEPPETSPWPASVGSSIVKAS